MPFKSEAQRRFMFAKHPKIAKEFQDATPENAKLPEHVKGYAFGGVAGDPFDIGVSNSTPTMGGYVPKPIAPPAENPFALTPSSGDLWGDLKAPNNATDAEMPPLESKPAPPDLGGSPSPSGLESKPVTQAPGATASAPSLSDILASAQKTGQSVYGDYSPDKRQELVKYMLQKQNSLGAGVGNALAGVGDAIARSYGHQDTNFLQGNLEGQRNARKEALGNFDEAQKAKAQTIQTGLSLEKMDPHSSASRAAQKLARPMLAAAGLSDAEIAEIPETAIDTGLKSATGFADFKQKMAAIAAQKEIGMGQRHDIEQDRLENQAMQRVSSIRGDTSLKDAEAKRDASITVYNTIENLKKEGRMPSPLEYYDLLGQMWKARSGATPTDQAIKDLDQRTFKGDLGRAVTYFTGKSSAATTKGVLDNIQDFAKDSGRQADAFHESYMKPHLIKPTGLDESRWKGIVEAGRGRSFADATKGNSTEGQPDHSAAMEWAQSHMDDPRAKMIMQRAQMMGGMNGLRP